MYAAERVEELPDGSYVFRLPEDEFHVDEKWFYISEVTGRVYLSRREAEEDQPHRTCRHKSHILKVMFLAAVACPRFDANGNCTFDGKIGVWPMVERVQAVRNSVNRPAGTWETKCMNVTKAVYTDYIVNKVLPAAIAKWPRDRGTRAQSIGMQQDNPTTHMKGDDPLWVEATNRHKRFKFHLREQPANSPDTNILDLGFFRALQSAYFKLKAANNIDGLIANVQKAWEEYDPVRLYHIWLSHQAVCEQILTGGRQQLQAAPCCASSAVQSRRTFDRNHPVCEEAMTAARLVRHL